MKIYPSARTARFEQLEVGELFIYLNDNDPNGRCYALKAAPVESGDRGLIVPLGPVFPGGIKECFLLDWQATTVLSFGKEFSVLLPTDPAAWTAQGPNRSPVCLAISEEKIYLCANAGPNPLIHVHCYVNVATGEVSQRLPSRGLFTNSWEIGISQPEAPPRIILKYPLQ